MNEHATAEEDTKEDVRPVRRSSLNFPVVGIGASAGGLQAALRFFEHLPSDSGMAFVLVMHLSPKHESNIADIVQRATRMPVSQVTKTTSIRVNNVYVIPPATEMQMDDGHLVVDSRERPHGTRPIAIDVFFRTLGQAHGERAIAIVLSGTGSDGTLGLADMKAEGGITLAQLPSDAEYEGMPSSAILAECVDFVLPVAEMPQKLLVLWENARHIQLPEAKQMGMMTDEPDSVTALTRAEDALRQVMSLLCERTGNDFQHYKRATMLRRLERRMQVTRQPDLPSYLAYLEAHTQETGALLQDMLISVTSFFRDRGAFDALEHVIYESLFARKPAPPHIRAWSVGCATGEEAYSLTMLLNDQQGATEPIPVQVFGTDINERALRTARSGIYPEAILNDLPPARLRQYLQKDAGTYRVRKSLREQVIFARHNVLHDPPFSRVDVIACRNLLIYLEREVQMQVLEIFHFALNPGGLLFLGSAETADPLPELFTMVDKKHRIYRTQASARVKRDLRSLNSSAFPLVPATVSTAMPSTWGPTSPVALLHERLLQQCVSPSLLIDATGALVHSSTGASRYLRHVEGLPSQAAVDVVKVELASAVGVSLLHARHTGRAVAATPVRLELDGQPRVVHITVRPDLQQPSTGSALVVFDELDDDLSLDMSGPANQPPREAAVLEEELRRLKQALQGSWGGETTSSGEEMHAANEELQSINEELRSTTEELETSKEELQSVNEELTTLNYELKGKVDEVAKVNDDLSNLIASMNIATVFVDRTMYIKRFTPIAAEIFNVLATDVGRSLLDLTHRLDYPSLREDLWRVLETLRFVEREVRGDDGRWYLVRISPYRSNEDRIEGAVINFVDVSEMHRVQQELRARDERLRLVAENTRDYAILTVDPKGVVMSFNKGAELIFGYTEPEIVGKPFGLLFVPEDQAAGVPEGELRQAREHGRAVDERWHIRKDGSRFFCSGITTPFHDSKNLGFAKIAHDLTERQMIESQREALLEAEKQVSKELEAANAMRSEFLAVMSHELKNPLNLILMSAELLARAPAVRASGEMQRPVDMIRRSVRVQSQIIDDLLDLSRLSTGKLSLQRTPVQFMPIVDRIAQAVQGEAQAHSVSLNVQGEDVTVLADAVRLEQIVWNLVSNAMKFTSAQGWVNIELATEGGFARLTVSDNGRGIDPAVIHKIFDMFEQGGAKASTRRDGGLGIGLALVAQLTELHDGRIEAHSDGAGTGSRFSVWIPLYSLQRELPETANGDDGDQLKGLRILLLEDNLDTLESMKTFLKMEGAEVTPAANGREALETARTGHFDLVISDVAMPDMDGLQVAAELRRNPHSRSWPVIALTGFSSEQDALNARQAGFDAHLAKPLSVAKLKQTVGQLRAKTAYRGSPAVPAQRHQDLAPERPATPATDHAV